MSRIIEIPGGSATIRSPEDVKQKARRRLEMASILASPVYKQINDARKKLEREKGGKVDPGDVNLMELGLTREDFDAMYEVQTATVLAYLESWTLERDLPKTAEELDELPAGLYDALREGTTVDGANAVAPVDFSPDPAPESPTVGDSASSKSLREEQGSPLTQRSSSSGERPLTAVSTGAATTTT
jgi:hypothetical protein